MFGFEYIYQADRLTKTAIILGIFIIIGLATRNWSGDIDAGKMQLDEDISHKFTGPHVGKKLELLVSSIILVLKVLIN
ncbi:putative membrane protein [Emiliania huxleyi virus 18]|nr:putative membrane protein [Emiliania huxleyi virus 18]